MKGKNYRRREGLRVSRALPKGYTLVIAEKPKAASRIAKALGLNRKGSIEGIPYWWGRFNGKYLVIAPSAGHLFTLSTNERGYPVFKYEWVPRWLVERNSSHLKKFFHALKTLAIGASEFINACDYDIEGSVIGYTIIKALGGLNRAWRVKFSSLTPEELRKAFTNIHPLDIDMVEAGLCRHELDWIWGINVSRALMDIFKKVNGEWRILSAGRVQSPTLIEAYKRFIERALFIPSISFTINIKVRVGNDVISLEPAFSPLNDYSTALKYVKQIRSEGVVKVIDAITSQRILNPPSPFNLPDLQVEASRIHGLSPAETLKIAEELYLEGLISYPRTNSQKLPPTLNNRRIISSLSKVPQYSTYALKLLAMKELRYREGSKEDPAHPAIYPTGELPQTKLSSNKYKVYDLIVRRYLASFGTNAQLEHTKYIMKAGTLKFSISGYVITKKGWLEIYPYLGLKTVKLPKLSVGDELKIESIRIITVYSKPPQLHTKTSLLKWMEGVNIGTEATRAEIIETLFRRGYLKLTRGGIEVTDIGVIVANILNTLFSELTSVNLTREFEEYISKVMRGELQRDDVVSKAKSIIDERLRKLKEMLRVSGKEYVMKVSNVGNENNKCSLCWRRGIYRVGHNIRLCNIHMNAYERIIKSYYEWKDKLGINFKSYLNKLIRLSSVGQYIKDVAKLMLDYGLKPYRDDT